MSEEEIRRRAAQDAQEEAIANYQKLLDAGIEPTPERLKDMMYESMERRFSRLFEEIAATQKQQNNDQA